MTGRFTSSGLFLDGRMSRLLYLLYEAVVLAKYRGMWARKVG